MILSKLASAAATLFLVASSSAAATGFSGEGKAVYEPTVESFRKWQQKFKTKSKGLLGHATFYPEGSLQEKKAFETWQSNLVRVRAHNDRARVGLETYTVAMNRFADLSNDEYRRTILQQKGEFHVTKSSPQASYTFHSTGKTTLPDSVNWVDEGVITGIKNQGQCGSCWAFSAAAAMEGAYNYKHQKQKDLDAACTATCGPKNITCCSFSEQEIVDCTLGGADTCKIGGEPHDGILNVVKRKSQINTESQYPYTSGGGEMGTCNPLSNAVDTGITGYANVTSGDESSLAEATYKFPVISVGIDASSFGFQLYDSGVYTDSECKNTFKALDHGVAVVGFGTGSPKPPGPPPPPPGPANCDKNYYKPECLGEKGCNWCVDQSGLGYCLNEPCPSKEKSIIDLGLTHNKSLPYWIVRNSWGKSWGSNG